MRYEEALAKLAGREDVCYVTPAEINAMKNSGIFTTIAYMCMCSVCISYYGSSPPADAVGWRQSTDFGRNKGQWICLK